MRARLYDAGGQDTDIDLSRETTGSLTPDQLLWVDLGREPEDLRQVAEALDLGDGLTALAEASRRPGLVRAEGEVRLEAAGLAKDDPGRRAVSVSFLARRGLVLSVHDGEVAGLDGPLRQTRGDTTLGELDAGAFLALLLDGLLGAFFEAVEEIERDVDAFDERALRTDEPGELLDELVALRRRIARLRRVLAPQRDVFSSQDRPDVELQEEILGATWSGLSQRFQLALQAIETARELLIGSFDIVMTRTGQRTNDVMKVLTVISAVLLPSVVLAGVMGMNFKVPIFDDATNFFVVLAIMVGLALGILLFARWRRWT
ncbi:MAG TPA: CorA family divalent cation transporter [Candidatus Limnocylindrales bacterium]|nr:CorA family divalent cation transporter [Candidatus Limnocylindrales bacterium]